MCPKGHELLGGGGPAAALRWRWHARGCAPCRKVSAAEAFVGAYAARAGRWPVEGERRRSPFEQSWRLALTATIIAALLPLLWPTARKLGQGSFRNPGATADRVWTITAATEEGKAIRTVHFVMRYRSSNKRPDGRWDDEPWQETEVYLAYPDKSSYRPLLQPDETITARSGDRELAYRRGGFSMDAYGPKHFQYRISRPVDPIVSPDSFTETGVVEPGLVCSYGPQSCPYRIGDPQGGKDLFTRRWESGDGGERVLVVEHTKAGEPSFHGTYRIRIDPHTRLVLGWDNTVKGMIVPGAQSYGYVAHEVVTAVEYNVEIPDGTFDTNVPHDTASEAVVDAYSPEGLKQYYDWTLRGIEDTKAKAKRPGVWQATRERLQNSMVFSRLDVLTPADRDEVLAKMRALGLDN